MDKKGYLKHIDFNKKISPDRYGSLNEDEPVIGEGPYSLDIFNYRSKMVLVLLNGKKQVYYTPYDDLEDVNEAYQALLKELKNKEK